MPPAPPPNVPTHPASNRQRRHVPHHPIPQARQDQQLGLPGSTHAGSGASPGVTRGAHSSTKEPRGEPLLTTCLPRRPREIREKRGRYRSLPGGRGGPPRCTGGGGGVPPAWTRGVRGIPLAGATAVRRSAPAAEKRRWATAASALTLARWQQACSGGTSQQIDPRGTHLLGRRHGHHPSYRRRRHRRRLRHRHHRRHRHRHNHLPRTARCYRRRPPIPAATSRGGSHPRGTPPGRLGKRRGAPTDAGQDQLGRRDMGGVAVRGQGLARDRGDQPPSDGGRAPVTTGRAAGRAAERADRLRRPPPPRRRRRVPPPAQQVRQGWGAGRDEPPRRPSPAASTLPSPPRGLQPLRRRARRRQQRQWRGRGRQRRRRRRRRQGRLPDRWRTAGGAAESRGCLPWHRDGVVGGGAKVAEGIEGRKGVMGWGGRDLPFLRHTRGPRPVTSSPLKFPTLRSHIYRFCDPRRKFSDCLVPR